MNDAEQDHPSMKYKRVMLKISGEALMGDQASAQSTHR